MGNRRIFYRRHWRRYRMHWTRNQKATGVAALVACFISVAAQITDSLSVADALALFGPSALALTLTTLAIAAGQIGFSVFPYESVLDLAGDPRRDVATATLGFSINERYCSQATVTSARRRRNKARCPRQEADSRDSNSRSVTDPEPWRLPSIQREPAGLHPLARKTVHWRKSARDLRR